MLHYSFFKIIGATNIECGIGTLENIDVLRHDSDSITDLTLGRQYPTIASIDIIHEYYTLTFEQTRSFHHWVQYPGKIYMKKFPGFDQLRGMVAGINNIIREGRGTSIEWKDDNTPVTPTDKRVNQAVIDWFEKSYPHISVIGEEGSRKVTQSEYTALIDPIDGTLPYILGLNISTFCIVIFKEKTPIVSIISEPINGNRWWAEKGHGTYLNNTRVFTSKQEKLDQACISLSFWSQEAIDMNTMRKQITAAKGKWIGLQSVGICGGLIASGKLTASVAPCKEAWETAAMALLVEEAGGTATDIDGKPLVYTDDFKINGHIISNGQGKIHDQLVAMVKQARN